MNPRTSGLIAVVILSCLLFHSLPAKAQSDEAAKICREIDETKAAIEVLNRRLQELEKRLQQVTKGGTHPGGPPGRLLFPVDIERAMLGEGYLKQRQLKRATPEIRTERFEFAPRPLAPMAPR